MSPPNAPRAAAVCCKMAVGSGLIRDVLVREEPLLFKPGQFYVIAAGLGVAGFTLLAFVFHAPLVPSAILAIATTFVFRLLAILFDWKTRSVMRSPAHEDEARVRQ